MGRFFVCRSVLAVIPAGWEGGEEMCMHKSNYYLSLHNDNYIFSVSRTHKCVYVICGSDMHLYKLLIIYSIIYGISV